MSKICSLRGISAPQLTPFREDGSINYGEYTRLTQFITDAGVHGVFVCCCFANKLRKIFIQSAKKKRRLKGF